MATRERRPVVFSGHPTFDWDEDNWRQQASCQTTDADLFFPIGNGGPAIDQIAAAKEVCNACPVRVECLSFALRTNQEAGIWGGTSEDERRKLRKRWLAERRRARPA
ncbi:MAG: WhiB family transcriptional regulator [Actinomycetota bacterium]|nr:WhiB family transcriptional regulator [Actinomycetota bacterium]